MKVSDHELFLAYKNANEILKTELKKNKKKLNGYRTYKCHTRVQGEGHQKESKNNLLF